MEWADGKRRCRWAAPRNALYVSYHDSEWGVPEHDDRRLFELLILEGFQAGLSWECVLNRREGFRAAFDGFDAEKVAGYGEEKLAALLKDRRIIRNRLKIAAAPLNARAFLELRREFGSFGAWLWSWTGGLVVHERGRTRSPLSDAVSRELKRRGMKFVGSTIVYAYLQAAGVVNSHEADCFLGGDCAAPAAGPGLPGGVMIRCCREGSMGSLLATPSGRSSAAVLGDFAFLAGEPDEELLAGLRAPLLVPGGADWEREIRAFHGEDAAAFERYAFASAPGAQDLDRLRRLAGPPAGYELRAMDAELFKLCLAHEWSRDLASQFESWEAFGACGLGFVLLRGGELCSGASSYAACPGALEIEVDTRVDQRRRGLARCCAARLVLECLERGIYPEWDAHSAASAALAESLGYGGRRAYTAFAVRR